MEETINLPSNIEEWTKDHVKLWITKQLKLDLSVGDIIYNQEVTGQILTVLTKKDLLEMGISHGPAVFIIYHLKKLSETCKKGQQSNQEVKQKGREAKQKKSKSKQSTHTTSQERKNSTEDIRSHNASKESENLNLVPEECSHSPSKTTPCPFDCTHVNKCYTQHHVLPPESGTSNHIDPVHEYKEFTNTETATNEDKKMKFCNEVFKFAAACMNARTNGTIHFGVRDKPHGEIIGVHIENSETYINYMDQMMNKYFEEAQLNLAKRCIRPPRFVRVLSQDNTTTNLCVIEVDVVPAHRHCISQIFYTYEHVFKDNTWKKSKEKCCFLRDGASSKDILANVQHNVAELKSFHAQTKDRDDARKRAEDSQIRKLKKSQEHGAKLGSLLTGNRDTLDNSYYKWYILVVNKCLQSHHTKNLDFVHEVPWFAVLDCDPESITKGLCKAFQETRNPSLHVPSQYQYIDNITDEKLEELKLYQKTAWIFCNGRLDLESQDYKPLDYKLWQKEKAADVRRLVAFLSRKDVLEREKFLVVFLLFSAVEDPADPMNEIFSAFYQELNGITDILCICKSEETFQSWSALQTRLVSEEEMEERCIFSLSIENVNGTILKLKSDTRSSSRFLPSHDGSSTILNRKDEDLMTSLNILCVNECHDTELEHNEPKFRNFIKAQEEHFYKGGKATWWNFYFSQKKYTGPFIERDIHKKLKEQILLWSKCDKQISVKMITLFHHPGCGGTTTAMHVLWELRDTFRCAMLKRKTDSFIDVAGEVINLAICGSPSDTDYPVLLLVDDYEEKAVSILQNFICSVIAKRYMKFEKPVVIILNCMRSQNPEKSSKCNCADSVPLTYKLSEQEQRAFEIKLMEIEEKYDKPHDFYSFMIMKSNFDKRYIENVVRNILKGLSDASKQAQLLSILALLNKYVKDSTISASMCKEFLGITAKKTCWGPESIEDIMGVYFTIMLCTEKEEYGGYQGLRISHPLIAKQCIEELMNTYNIEQSSIMLSLLGNNVFRSIGIGREILCENMQSMLVTRHRKEHGDEADTLFSPLIEEIQNHEGNLCVKNVLKEGTLRFNQNPYICQALARHFYIREKNFPDAFIWANKAKQIAPTNSFILDTLGQIYKTQLKSMLDTFSKYNPISPKELKNLLETAKNASIVFRKCQEQTEKTERERTEVELTKDRCCHVYNTEGYLGHIEVCLYTVELLLQIPCFHSSKILKEQLMQCLSGKWDIPVDNASEDYKEFHNVLSEFRSFLIKLNTYLKTDFDFFQDYFVYTKPQNIVNESSDFKTREKVSEYYIKYREHFCNIDLVQITEDNPCVSDIKCFEVYRLGLQFCKADRFSGILEYLTDHVKEDKNKNMEAIVRAYMCLHNITDKFNVRNELNFILANIVLHCISPKSKRITPYETLKRCLIQVLQFPCLDYKLPELYFLVLILFFPQEIDQWDSDSTYIADCIISMGTTFRDQYRHMYHARQPIAHFYLGKHTGLNRLVHKGKIDEHFRVPTPDLNSLWQSGDIWKQETTRDLLLLVNGSVKDNMIYVTYGGGIKIPVRPVYLEQLRSDESIKRVSFYLGFSMDGLIAYNIESL